MRPVNLIPAELRRSGKRPGRGPVGAYLLVGALVAVLAGVTGLVLTKNSISESEAEVAQLQQEEAAAEARAESLAAFADFSTAQADRTATITTLAQSRFDWERVLRELAIVIPDGVVLENLTGTVSSDVSLASSDQSGLRPEVVGPALSIRGCAPDQETVAAFIAALEDIDGVTRVGISDSETGLTDISGSGGAAGGAAAACAGATFNAVAAFDEVTVPTAAPAPPPASTPTAEDGGVADAAQQQAQAAQSVQESAQAAESVVNENAGN